MIKLIKYSQERWNIPVTVVMMKATTINMTDASGDHIPTIPRVTTNKKLINTPVWP